VQIRALVVMVGFACATPAVLINPEQAHAEEGRKVTLSLAEALRRAEATSPEVAVAESVVREAEARRIGAGIVMPVNPRLSFDVRPTVTGGPPRELGYGAALDFLFEPGGAPAARVREAEHEAGVARADLAFDRSDARYRAFTAYVRTQIAELRIAESRSALEVSSRVLSAAERRLAAGAASELEQASAELDVGLLRASEVAATRERDASLMELRDVLALGPAALLELSSSLGEPPPLGEPRRYVEGAMKRHPSLAALSARGDFLASHEERLEREIFPRVGLYGGIDAAPLSPIFGVVGLSVELPVAQRNQTLRAVTARAREGIAARLEIESARLARRVVAAYEACEARRKELATLTERAVPAATRTLSLAEAGWQAGRFDVFRLLTATRDALRVRAHRIDALEAVWISYIELERAAGGEVRS
jgi:cobalt-zinc-cadmium efflux system outer membrane protein